MTLTQSRRVKRTSGIINPASRTQGEGRERTSHMSRGVSGTHSHVYPDTRRPHKIYLHAHCFAVARDKAHTGLERSKY